MSKVFDEHKELRFLGWCANYKVETYFDGVSFDFNNYLVHRNSNVLLKGLNLQYCKCHFCKTFSIFHRRKIYQTKYKK